MSKDMIRCVMSGHRKSPDRTLVRWCVLTNACKGVDACWWLSGCGFSSDLLQSIVYWIVVDSRDGLLKVRHSGRTWPMAVEPSTVVQLEPRATSSSQESSTSNHNELLALLPEHSELQAAAPAESTSWWRCVHVFHYTLIQVFNSIEQHDVVALRWLQRCCFQDKLIVAACSKSAITISVLQNCSLVCRGIHICALTWIVLMDLIWQL